MLHLVTDWHYLGNRVFIACPGCDAMMEVPRSALDPDGCVYLDCCGGRAVRLDGKDRLPPRSPP